MHVRWESFRVVGPNLLHLESPGDLHKMLVPYPRPEILIQLFGMNLGIRVFKNLTL